MEEGQENVYFPEGGIVTEDCPQHCHFDHLGFEAVIGLNRPYLLELFVPNFPIPFTKIIIGREYLSAFLTLNAISSRSFVF